MQCYHYMSVCNADAWYIAVVIYGREFKYYRIERDEEALLDLQRMEQNFWENHVLKRILPKPDGSELADKVISGYFQKSMKETKPLTSFDEKLDRRQELELLLEEMTAEKKQIEQELKLYLGEAETAENANYRVSWKSVSSQRIDEKRLREERPEVYEQYRKTLNFRRFTIKAA